MNKNAIQKYAVWARNELIAQVRQRAYQYGITQEGYGDANASVIGGRVLSPTEKSQREAFVAEIKLRGYQLAVEEVAYTWFNRFIALRFMEVNDYLPTHIRVFSDASGGYNPEILRDVLHLELPNLNRTRVAELLNDKKTEELYRYILLVQCNALSAALPEMFEQMGAYTEMLLPNNILKPDSVLGRLVTDIPEDDWKDAVQIIGWMYQYYNTEPKQAVFDGLKKNIKINKDNIPAATQLFTPDWIVRYMVENSLGRLWLESHPSSGLRANWKYYLNEAEQTPEVAEKLRMLRAQSPVKSPEDIRLIDPCMGSGHILVYAFDVLMQIYRECGYADRDAAKLILEKNLYGLDIDRRAYQLAYFALMMKARKHSRRIFAEDIQPQVYHPKGWADGEEYGSLARVDELPPTPSQMLSDDITYNPIYNDELRVWSFQRLLAQKYDVVVTNPPYMGSSGIGSKLSAFLKNYYTDYKSDTFSAFIMRCGDITKPTGFVGMFSPYVWMFIQSYEKLRYNIYRTKNLTTLIQFEYSAFEEATVPVCSFVYRNSHTGENGSYFRLVEYRGGMEVQRQKYLEAIDNPKCGFFYIANTDNFSKIPGAPVAYWASEHLLNVFSTAPSLKVICDPKVGLQTADNNRFLRLWYECNYASTGFGYRTLDETVTGIHKWFPYNKGGEFRRWFGNREYLINWWRNGSAVRSNPGAVIRNPQYYLKECITWSDITSAVFSGRYCEGGFLFDVKGSSGFPRPDMKAYALGLLNSCVAQYCIKILNPTISTQVGDMSRIPVYVDKASVVTVANIVSKCVEASRIDWDSFETSWDFQRHPLV